MIKERKRGELNIPEKIQSGDSYQWKISHPNFKSSDGWSFTLHIRGVVPLDIDGETQENGSYNLNLSSEQSSMLSPGIYKYQGRFVKENMAVSPGEYRGQFEVLPNLAKITQGIDARDKLQKVIDEIDIAIEELIKNPVQAVTINNKSYQNIRLSELYSMKKKYEYALKRQKQAERLGKGIGRPNIVVRFGKP